MDSEKVLKILEELGQKKIIEKFKSVSPQEQKDFIELNNIIILKKIFRRYEYLFINLLKFLI